MTTPPPPRGAPGGHDDVPCGYLRTTDDGDVVEANRMFLDSVGRSADEVVGRLRFLDLLAGGSRIYHETHFRPLLHVNGEVSSLALDLRHADGSRRSVLVNARRVHAADGTAAVHIATFEAGGRRDYERELLRATRQAERSEARAVALSRTLQASLVPPVPPAIAGLDVAAVYRPAGSGDEVGGDFYDVFQVGDDEWVIAIGDVEGKGVEAATVATLARHVVRTAAIRVWSPRECLLTLNEVLLADPTDRLLTAAVVRLARTDAGWLVMTCAAGHALPTVVHAEGSPLDLGHPGTLLGVVAAPRLEDHRTELAPGDVLVMCTDGVVEARPASGGEFFGEDRFLDLVRSRPTSAAGLTAALLEAVVAFSGGVTRDDVAVVAVVVP